jgi:hypothetical protein
MAIACHKNGAVLNFKRSAGTFAQPMRVARTRSILARFTLNGANDVRVHQVKNRTFAVLVGVRFN